MDKKKLNTSPFRPVQILVGSFLIMIIVGTILLMLPWSQTSGAHHSFLDCLFTATSGVCVTGLVVLDTASDWSRAGQIIILVLFQFGGIGVVSFGALFALILGQKINFRQRQLIKEQYGQTAEINLLRLIPIVAATTLGIELTGAALLAPRFMKDFGTSEGIWHSVFHSVSAFCNAGFSTFANSLENYTGDLWVNAVICFLIIIGGLGFPVLAELLERKQHRKRLSLHARVVLWSSGVLIAVGAILIFAVESGYNPEFGEMGFGSRVLASIFQSITARTAGFNTVPISHMAPASLLAMQILMVIGGSPSGTAGGIKTTTIVSGIAAIRAVLFGRAETRLMDRRLSSTTTRKALVLILLAALVISIGTFLMLLTSGSSDVNLLKLGFETVSAFGTVGLTTGITSELTTGQRIVIIFLMFVGRLGPMTFALAIASPKAEQVKYPETDLLTG